VRYHPGLVMYWFVKSVTQPQDRSLLPSNEEWSESANTAGEEYAKAEFAKVKGGTS
jgi:hypothetical protein